MLNEVIFFAHTFVLGTSTVLALWSGLPALTSLMCLQAVLANIFVLKQITLFGLTVTCTDAFAVGCSLTLNIIQEYYGKASAKRALFTSLGALVLYLVLSQLHLLYIPASFDVYQTHWLALLNTTPRIIFASLTAFACAQSIDYYLYGLLQKKPLPFIIRNYGSLAVSQLADTVIFGVLGLYGLVHSVSQIIILSYVIKLLVIIFYAPTVGLLRKYFAPHQ